MDIFEINDIPAPSQHRKSESFEKRTHSTPDKNEHPDKRRNTNSENVFDASPRRPLLNLEKIPPAPPIFPQQTRATPRDEVDINPQHEDDDHVEEHQISVSPKESSEPILDRILSLLERQSKTLEQLNTRIDAIEESRSERSSRSQSRASEKARTKPRSENASTRALKTTLLHSREQRERKADLPSMSKDDDVPAPPKLAPYTFDKGVILEASRASRSPFLYPARIMPRAQGCYIRLEESGKFWAEIRTKDNPQYRHDAIHSPEIPHGYIGEWIITDENPSR